MDFVISFGAKAISRQSCTRYASRIAADRQIAQRFSSNTTPRASECRIPYTSLAAQPNFCAKIEHDARQRTIRLNFRIPEKSLVSVLGPNTPRHLTMNSCYTLPLFLSVQDQSVSSIHTHCTQQALRPSNDGRLCTPTLSQTQGDLQPHKPQFLMHQQKIVSVAHLHTTTIFANSSRHSTHGACILSLPLNLCATLVIAPLHAIST